MIYFIIGIIIVISLALRLICIANNCRLVYSSPNTLLQTIFLPELSLFYSKVNLFQLFRILKDSKREDNMYNVYKFPYKGETAVLSLNVARSCLIIHKNNFSTNKLEELHVFFLWTLIYQAYDVCRELLPKPVSIFTVKDIEEGLEVRKALEDIGCQQ